MAMREFLLEATGRPLEPRESLLGFPKPRLADGYY
jgi:hypothetical protein